MGFGLDVMHGGEALSGITSKQLSLPDKSIPDSYVGPSLISDVKNLQFLKLYKNKIDKNIIIIVIFVFDIISN